MEIAPNFERGSRHFAKTRKMLLDQGQNRGGYHKVHPLGRESLFCLKKSKTNPTMHWINRVMQILEGPVHILDTLCQQMH